MRSGSARRGWVPGLVPLVLLGVGALHSVVGFSAGAGTLAAIAREGFWNTVHSGEGPPGRDLVLWFLLSGFLLMILGHLALWVERRLRRPLPRAFGLEFLAVSLAVLILSGGGLPAWILAAASAYVLVARPGRDETPNRERA